MTTKNVLTSILITILTSVTSAPTSQKSGRAFFPSFLDVPGPGIPGSYVNNEISRNMAPDSPIYYIRLPPIPYSYVPGFGYISHSDNPMSSTNAFVNLPINFVSNGKPSTIYRWSGAIDIPPTPKPTLPPILPQDSLIHNLPGKFAFNGKVTDLYLLKDPYSSLFDDTLQTIYP